MRIPDVGMTVFEKPSPHVNAKTAVWRVRPRTSERGAMSGMVTAAWPDPEGMKKLRIDWITLGLGLAALMAVGGMIPFWLWVYYAISGVR